MYTLLKVDSTKHTHTESCGLSVCYTYYNPHFHAATGIVYCTWLHVLQDVKQTLFISAPVAVCETRGQEVVPDSEYMQFDEDLFTQDSSISITMPKGKYLLCVFFLLLNDFAYQLSYNF